MSAGMAGIIAAHSGHSVKLSPQGMFTVHCHGCGRSTPAHAEGKLPRSGAPIHAAHVAEELAKAGYGNVKDALPAVSNATVSTGDVFESTDQESAELSGSAAVLE